MAENSFEQSYSAETHSVTRRALRSVCFSNIGGQVFIGFPCTCVTVADRLYEASQMDNKRKKDKALAPHCPDHNPVMDKSVKLDTGCQFLLHSNSLEGLSLSPGVCHLSHVSKVCPSIEVTIIPIPHLEMVD